MNQVLLFKIFDQVFDRCTQPVGLRTTFCAKGENAIRQAAFETLFEMVLLHLVSKSTYAFASEDKTTVKRPHQRCERQTRE